jgi:hypothetical protein
MGVGGGVEVAVAVAVAAVNFPPEHNSRPLQHSCISYGNQYKTTRNVNLHSHTVCSPFLLTCSVYKE